MKRLLLTALSLLAFLTAFSQRPGEIESVADRFDEYDAELKNLTKKIGRANDLAALDDFDKSLADLNTRWDLYYQSSAALIGGNKTLLDACTQLMAVKDDLGQKAADKRLALQSQADFEEAGRFMAGKDSLYRRLLKSAKRYSQIQMTAAQLKKVQGKEQLLTAQLDQRYSAAQAASENIKWKTPKEKEEALSELEEKYLNLKNYSAQIQECQYKPFIERIRDWLMSFAAVAVILMFANMVQGKIQAAKQMKENMKKMQEQLHKNDDEIPSI
ncbi:MAG: hypothetical protein J6Y32_06910 [Bacteroidales bacterium]|nr:hypothetical protein [Bacteroidales bacterium]